MSSSAWKLLKTWQARPFPLYSVHILGVPSGERAGPCERNMILVSRRGFPVCQTKFMMIVHISECRITCPQVSREEDTFLKTVSGRNVKNFTQLPRKWVLGNHLNVPLISSLSPPCWLVIVQTQTSWPQTMSPGRRTQSSPNPNQLVFQQQTTRTVAIF